MPEFIAIDKDTKVFVSVVGYYDIHYPNSNKWMTMGGLALPVVSGPKIAHIRGLASVLLPAEVVRMCKLPSAVGWVHES